MKRGSDRRPRSPRATSTVVDAREIGELAAAMAAAGLSELEVETGRLRIRLVRATAAPSAGVGPPPASLTGAEPARTSGQTITSPMVGTFHRAPAPGAAPFVELGDLVERGQVLCVVEAMKMMNEIEAECRGRVAEILVEDGGAIEYGERLFVIEPDDRSAVAPRTPRPGT